MHPGGGLWPLLLISFATSDSTIKQAGALSSPGSHELDWDEVDATALEMLRGGGWIERQDYAGTHLGPKDGEHTKAGSGAD